MRGIARTFVVKQQEGAGQKPPDSSLVGPWPHYEDRAVAYPETLS